MAESARAASQSPSSTASADPGLEALTLQACDEASQLHEVLQAHVCIERLIAPNGIDDPEDITTTRSELSALLRLANSELRSRIDAIESTTLRLRQSPAFGESGKKLA
jgi:hypothetical protein